MSKFVDAIIGHAVGDAMGVLFDFDDDGNEMNPFFG